MKEEKEEYLEGGLSFFSSVTPKSSLYSSILRFLALSLAILPATLSCLSQPKTQTRRKKKRHKETKLIHLVQKRTVPQCWGRTMPSRSPLYAVTLASRCHSTDPQKHWHYLVKYRMSYDGKLKQKKTEQNKCVEIQQWNRRLR